MRYNPPFVMLFGYGATFYDQGFESGSMNSCISNNIFQIFEQKKLILWLSLQQVHLTEWLDDVLYRSICKLRTSRNADSFSNLFMLCLFLNYFLNLTDDKKLENITDKGIYIYIYYYIALSLVVQSVRLEHHGVGQILVL